MEHFVNQPFLTKRAKIARWGSYVGLGALFIGLMSSMRYPLLSYAFLLIGLLGAAIGSYMANHYVREPRADQVLAQALDGLDKRFALYSYYLPSNHVLASHLGLTVLEPRAQSGEITFQKGRWHHQAGWRKILQIFGEPTLGRPDQDLLQEIKWVKEWVEKAMPEEEIPVNGIIVFTNPKVTLNLKDQPPVPAVTAEELPRFLKESPRTMPVLTTAKQKALRRLLDEVVAQG